MIVNFIIKLIIKNIRDLHLQLIYDYYQFTMMLNVIKLKHKYIPNKSHRHSSHKIKTLLKLHRSFDSNSMSKITIFTHLEQQISMPTKIVRRKSYHLCQSKKITFLNLKVPNTLIQQHIEENLLIESFLKKQLLKSMKQLQSPSQLQNQNVKDSSQMMKSKIQPQIIKKCYTNSNASIRKIPLKKQPQLSRFNQQNTQNQQQINLLENTQRKFSIVKQNLQNMNLNQLKKQIKKQATIQFSNITESDDYFKNHCREIKNELKISPQVRQRIFELNQQGNNRKIIACKNKTNPSSSKSQLDIPENKIAKRITRQSSLYSCLKNFQIENTINDQKTSKNSIQFEYDISKKQGSLQLISNCFRNKAKRKKLLNEDVPYQNEDEVNEKQSSINQSGKRSVKLFENAKCSPKNRQEQLRRKNSKVIAQQLIQRNSLNQNQTIFNFVQSQRIKTHIEPKPLFSTQFRLASCYEANSLKMSGSYNLTPLQCKDKRFSIYTQENKKTRIIRNEISRNLNMKIQMQQQNQLQSPRSLVELETARSSHMQKSGRLDLLKLKSEIFQQQIGNARNWYE